MCDTAYLHTERPKHNLLSASLYKKLLSDDIMSGVIIIEAKQSNVLFTKSAYHYTVVLPSIFGDIPRSCEAYNLSLEVGKTVRTVGEGTRLRRGIHR